MKKTDQLIELARHRGALRASELAARGISRVFLKRLCDAGMLERVSRGVYALVDRDITQHHGLVLATKRVPHGVIVLLSALQFHGLGTQLPHEVWMAVDRGARKPSTAYPPLRIVRFSGGNLTYGVEEHLIEDTPLHITSKAKTVADCFKYRTKIGLDVAIEALRDFVRSKGSIDELWRSAGLCRVERIIRPYMESTV